MNDEDCMKEIKMTWRSKEVLKNHPIIKNILWILMGYVVTAAALLTFSIVLILFPFLMIIHYTLYVITGGKVKIMRFEK